MNAHLFTSTTGTKGACTICGKTRNTKAHKDAKALDAQVDAQTAVADAMEQAGIEVEELDPFSEEANEVAVSQGDEPTRDEVVAEEGDAVLKAEAAKRSEDTKKALKAKAAAKKNTVSIWVGWRITNAAVLQDTKVAKKLRDAKPTADLDRTVKLTVEELQELDALATEFMGDGHTGPEVYSGRALRGRIAAALAKLQ